MGTQDKKLGLGLLITLGIGSMIGGGIFNSPTDLITKANPQAALIAWIIGGFGIICLALVFQFLANKRPDLKGGIYSYAQDGFGDFMGFNSAWGYWLSAWLGNIAFIILMFKTINSLLGPGNELKPIISFIAATLLLWVVHFIQTKGTKSAGIINAVVTIGKLLPLALVIILGIFIFKPDLFTVQNWSTVLASSGESTSLLKQINGAMGTIIWCFIGVEASVVLSEKAESQAIVGKATVISLLVTLLIYVSISLLAMGIIPAKELVASGTPLAEVLSKTVFGGAGGVIVKLGLITSLFGALISWVMLAAEIPYVAAKDGVMPKWFAKENSANVPINSLTFTNIVSQIFLCSLLSDKLQSAYGLVFAIATTCMLIPYALSSFYAIKVCNQENINGKDKVIAILSAIYTLYGIYAGGIKYFALAFIMYAFGIIVFHKAKKEKGVEYTSTEKIASIIVVAVGVLMVILLATGKISL
ncbi:basic amino acid/polyamine antiporter [Clostridium tepidum]|uniref:basic amino acid/polyamine antiporter n=1 Tax=Clostridium tepidum TaxID=1962263 RepID=UPI002149FB4B|nr:basic amino acid/polyamine antiporter [Clostridium tepidum]MCR1934017.1 basic amino acid/polyamine antiporter [Clostridium tepidum]